MISTEPGVLMALNDGHCPDCGHGQFLTGPEGGLMTNIKCDKCGSVFNYCPPCYAAPKGKAARISMGAMAEDFAGEQHMPRTLATDIHFELQRLAWRCAQFQIKYFPNQTLDGVAAHLGDELHELTANPADHEERADVLILTLAVLFRAALKQDHLETVVRALNEIAATPIPFHELVRLAHAKIDKNEKRKWAPADERGVFHHTEEGN